MHSTAPLRVLVRPRPEIRLSTDKTQLVEPTLHAIVNDRFDNVLKISRLPKSVYPDRIVWIVSSRDPDYLFGFRVSLRDNVLQVKNGVNTWSHWAEDLMRIELARRLLGNLDTNSNNIGLFQDFIDIKQWAKKFGIEAHLENIPKDFKRVAGIQ